MPRWWAEYQEAQACNLALPALQAWCWHGAGAYYLPRLRVGWAIEAEAERQRWARTKQPPRDFTGWHGGEADPDDSVAGWEDDGCPEAA